MGMGKSKTDSTPGACSPPPSSSLSVRSAFLFGDAAAAASIVSRFVLSAPILVIESLHFGVNRGPFLDSPEDMARRTRQEVDSKVLE